jgi:hypothetical protein
MPNTHDYLPAVYELREHDSYPFVEP